MKHFGEIFLFFFAAQSLIAMTDTAYTCEDLHEAVRDNDFAAVKEIVCFVDTACIYKGRSVFHVWAKVDGSYDVFFEIASHLNLLDTPDNDGNTPFLLAARKSNYEVMLWLFQYGHLKKHPIDVNARNRKGYTALHYASINGDDATQNVLLRLSANLDLKTNKGNTALHISAVNGDLKRVKNLVQAKADINAKNRFLITPLIASVKQEHYSVAKYLISQGANVNSKDAGGDTALHHAARNDDEEFMLVLLENKADLTVINQDRETPAHVATRYMDILSDDLLSHFTNIQGVGHIAALKPFYKRMTRNGGYDEKFDHLMRK